jgi:hypothetical protein
MDDSIKRKIVLYESEMDLDLEWTRLESRLQKKRRRGFIFYFLFSLAGTGLLTSGVIAYDYFSEKNSSTFYTENYRLYSKNTSKGKNSAHSIPENENTVDNSFNSNTSLQTNNENSEKLPAEKVNNSTVIIESGNSKTTKSGNLLANKDSKNKNSNSTKIDSMAASKELSHNPILQLPESPLIHPEIVEEVPELPGIFPEIISHDQNFELTHDNTKIHPLNKKSPFLSGWWLEIGFSGNITTDASIKTENSTDLTKLDRKSLEIIHYHMGVSKQLTRNITLGAGYERQFLFEKFSSSGTGYHIKPINNALIASGPDHQNRVYGSANVVTEVKYNIVSYNKHLLNWIYLNPNYHLQSGKFEANIGGTYYYNLHGNYQFSNISEPGEKIISKQQSADANKYSISIGLSRNISDRLQLGVNSSYFFSEWNYDFSSPTFQEPNILMQGSGINEYKLNSFSLGLNLKYMLY